MITNLSVDMPEVERFKFVKTAVTTSNFEMIEERAKKIKEVLSNKADALKQQYEQARDSINALLTERSKIQAEAQQATDISKAEYELRLLTNKPIEEISIVLNTARNLLGTARVNGEGLKRQLESLKELTKRRLEIETSEFKKQITGLQEKIHQIEQRFSAEQERSNQLSRLIEEQEQLHPRLLSLAELASHGKTIGLIDGSCPLCGLHISESDYMRHIQELLHSIQAQEKAMTKLTDDHVQSSSNMRNLHNELSKEKIALDNMSMASEFVIVQLRKITAEIANYGLECESEMSLTPELIEDAITSRRRQMSEIEKHIAVMETSKAIEKAISLDREISIARKVALDYEKKLERVERAKGRAESLYSALRRIAGEIVDEQLAALSPLFSELYFRLRPHVDWPDVKYHIRGDVRRFLSLRVGDELNLRFMFSSGQRRATGLAFLLAVNQSLGWSKFKTLILDDPVHHIDDYRALHLAEVLASIRLSKQQIICTVEDSALADLLCRRLRSSESEEGILITMEYSTGEGAKVASQRKIYPTPTKVLLSA